MNDMEATITRPLAFAAVLIAALSVSAPVMAKSVSAGISVQIGSGYHGIHGKARRRHGLHRHHYLHGRYQTHRFRGHRGPGVGHRYFRGPRGCHPVSRYAHDRYGDLIKLRGIMCYDLYGRGYVVPGSERARQR